MSGTLRLDRDIKQIWKKFEQVGQQMAGLASSLSAISQAYQKQASGVSEIDMTKNKVEETSLVDVAHKALRELLWTLYLGNNTSARIEGVQPEIVASIGNISCNYLC